MVSLQYTGNGSYRRHGLEVSENEYGSHLSLNVDGTEHLHVRAFNTSAGDRAVDLAVNNAYTEDDPDNDSWTFIRAREGDTKASVTMYGAWNVSPENVNFYTGATACDMRVPAGTSAVTGTFIVKSSSNGTEFFYRLCFVNGLLMKIEIA